MGFNSGFKGLRYCSPKLLDWGTEENDEPESKFGHKLSVSGASTRTNKSDYTQHKRTSTWTVQNFFDYVMTKYVGRSSSVRIATRYGLDCSGIESRWGRDFPHPPRLALGPTQPPIQCVPAPSREQGGRAVALTTHPHLAPRLRKE
jgi:hypothetical protein